MSRTTQNKLVAQLFEQFSPNESIDVSPIVLRALVKSLRPRRTSSSPSPVDIRRWSDLPPHVQAAILTLSDSGSATSETQTAPDQPTVQFNNLGNRKSENSTLERRQRTLFAALRHVPERFGLQMDSEGWVDLLEIDPLLSSITDCRPLHDRGAVRAVLQQFEIGERVQFDSDYCRAAYGHSTPRFAPKAIAIPDCCLYHGTTVEAYRLIDCFGLNPNGRRFVQLTNDLEYANHIAMKANRSPIVLQVANTAAIESGVQFYSTGTHVWLATMIPPDCLQVWVTGSNAAPDCDGF